MNKLNDKILHINCDKPLSKETIKLINRMVEIASHMTEKELKEFNKVNECPHLKTHMRNGFITCSKCKKPFY